MYYVHDLLSYRTGTFGKLWFVAHNPSKMKNRRDFAAVVIAEKCQELLQHFPFSTASMPLAGSYPLNGVPLSIRTCSHIMFGIVFVFHKQCEFLYQDSQRLLTNLKPMRLNLKDPKKTRDLPPNEFIMNVPPLPDNWEWDLISPTEQARFLENMNMEAQDQILIFNTEHRVENMNDITLREEETDARLKSSGMYAWPQEGQGLHPDDRPLTDQEIQQQWILMNNSTDVIAEFLNPSTSGLIPDPAMTSDLAPEMQQSLDLLGLIELQDQQMLVDNGMTDIGVGGKRSRLTGNRSLLRKLSDSDSDTTGSGWFAESEAFAKLKSKPLVVDEIITGKENLERQVNVDGGDASTSGRKDSNVPEPLQASNIQDTALTDNINLFNAGLSITLLSNETPLVRASQSAEALEVKNRRKVTPAVTVEVQTEAPPRGSKRDSMPETRFSEASVRRFPDLSIVEPQPVDGIRRKRRYRFLDLGPIEISNKAIKSCLQDCSDILRPFVRAALEENMKADELLSAAGRGKHLGGVLSEVWKEALERQNEVSSEQPLPDASLAGMSIEAMREQASANALRNVTDPLSNSSRQIAEQTPKDPIDPNQVPDPKALEFNNTNDMSKSLVENETLRTIPEIRETSGIIDPVIPVDMSIPPPVPVNTSKTTFDITLDLDSSLSMNNNDEKVLDAIGKGIQKLREENDNENINVDSVLFGQICAPGMCKKRLACRTFYSLLNLAKMEKISLKQPKMSEVRRIRDPIYIQVL